MSSSPPKPQAAADAVTSGAEQSPAPKATDSPTSGPEPHKDDMAAASAESSQGAGTQDDVECISPPRQTLRMALPKPNERSAGAGDSRSSTKPKRMLQATLAFGSEGTGVTEERLRRDLAERDNRIEELTSELQTTRASLANQTHGRDETSQQLTEAEMRMGRYQEAMKDLMIETARTHRRDARRWQHQQHFELGHIASMPNPVNGMSEVWVEGNTARRLINEQNDIQMRQKEVEARKPPPRSRRQPQGDDDGTDLGVEEEAEMRKMELAALRAAEQDVSMKRAQYKQDIDAFVKEVRRIHDEDASPFALRDTIGRICPADDNTNSPSKAAAGSITATPSGFTAASSGPEHDAAAKHEERYVLLYLLGRGGFSEVWKAFDLTEGRYVACKVHKVNRQWSGAAQHNYLKHAERELDIQRLLDHPRLMKLYDVFQYDSTTFVSVMEFSAGEDLERRLKRARSFREAESRVIMMQVLSALRHLAEQESPVIHYDLKPANIIFHSSLPSCLEVKVTDFGLSKVINLPNGGPAGGVSDPSVELTSQQCGTFYYLPPECFASGAKVTPKVDVWSCGVIFYQMLYGRRPFASDASQADIFNNKLIVSHARKGVEFPAKPVVSAEAKDVIRRCLTFDVAHRPDVAQLCNDPYFTRRGAKRGRTSAVSSGSAIMAAPRSEGTSSPVAQSMMPPPS